MPTDREKTVEERAADILLRHWTSRASFGSTVYSCSGCARTLVRSGEQENTRHQRLAQHQARMLNVAGLLRDE